MDEQRSLDVKSDIIYWILLMLSLYKGEILLPLNRAERWPNKKYDKFRMSRHTNCLTFILNSIAHDKPNGNFNGVANMLSSLNVEWFKDEKKPKKTCLQLLRWACIVFGLLENHKAKKYRSSLLAAGTVLWSWLSQSMAVYVR